MKLSIGMMVKNEDKNLERCLTSLQPLLKAVSSELIIVDTGSTDHTVDIARKFTDKVYFHPWENDYAKMRNITVNYAQGEWFMFVDADEELVEYGAIVDFLTTKKSKQFNAACIKIHNFFQSEDTSGYSTALVGRLFRKTGNFHFRGVVHEEAVYNPPITWIDALIVHYGYVNNSPELKARKFALYEPILTQALEKDPENINLWYYLAQTYSTYKDQKEALEPAMKAYELIRDKKLSPGKYIHVLITLTSLQLLNGNLAKAEELAEEGLRYKEWAIDLWFYKAKAQAIQKKNREAVESYQKYFYYLERHAQYAGEDTKIISSTITKEDEARLDLSVLYKEIGEKLQACQELKRINSGHILQKGITHALALYLDLENYQDLQGYYDRVRSQDEESLKVFRQILEKFLTSADSKKQAEVSKLFKDEPSEYGLLHTIRLLKETESVSQQVLDRMKALDFSQLEDYYGDILYLLIQRNLPLESIDLAVSEEKLEAYVAYMVNKYDHACTAFLAYLHDRKNDLSGENKLPLEEIRVIKHLERAILLADSVGDEQYERVLDIYIQDGIDTIRQIYQGDILQKGKQHLLRNKEEVFFLYMKLAKSVETANKAEYIRNLKRALQEYPCMKKGIEILLHRMTKQSLAAKPELSNEMQAYAQIVKRNLEQLVRQGLFKEAKEIIRGYEQLIPNDPDISRIKAEIETAER